MSRISVSLLILVLFSACIKKDVLEHPPEINYNTVAVPSDEEINEFNDLNNYTGIAYRVPKEDEIRANKRERFEADFDAFDKAYKRSEDTGLEFRDCFFRYPDDTKKMFKDLKVLKRSQDQENNISAKRKDILDRYKCGDRFEKSILDRKLMRKKMRKVYKDSFIVEFKKSSDSDSGVLLIKDPVKKDARKKDLILHAKVFTNKLSGTVLLASLAKHPSLKGASISFRELPNDARYIGSSAHGKVAIGRYLEMYVDNVKYQAYMQNILGFIP